MFRVNTIPANTLTVLAGRILTYRERGMGDGGQCSFSLFLSCSLYDVRVLLDLGGGGHVDELVADGDDHAAHDLRLDVVGDEALLALGQEQRDRRLNLLLHGGVQLFGCGDITDDLPPVHGHDGVEGGDYGPDEA